MDQPAQGLASRVLHALADLAPTAEERSSGLVIPTEWFRWLPVSAVRLFLPMPTSTGTITIDRRLGNALAAVDRIRPGQRSLRAGWLFVAGRMQGEDGRLRRVFHPLVTIPVRIDRFAGTSLVPAGDVELSRLIADRAEAEELERSIEYGGGALDAVHEVTVPVGLLSRLPRLQHFARAAAEAARLPATEIIPAKDGPDALLRRETLAIVVGVGVYAVHETGGTSRASSLRAWAGGRLEEATAFHRLYLDLPPPAPPPSDGSAEVASPFLLTPAQTEAVRRSRHDPITLVSGAPGTGKSHTIAAVACDALARGQTVLVAAKSDATVDALLDLLERSPGPDPVVFGSSERREALAARLSGGQLQPESENVRESASSRLRTAGSRRNRLWADIADRLRAESLLDTPEDEVAEGRRHTPLLFEPATDLASADRLLAAATAPAGGWWSRRRRRKAARRLRQLAGAGEDLDPRAIADLLAVARSARLVADLLSAGGLEIGERWEELRAADDEARAALGRWIAADSRSGKRLNFSTLPAVAALATALRSGRSARREQLRRLNDEKLTTALPLWVGTLADIEDLLPAVPALFDLVILDEASSIDQVLAAPALLRGARALVAGDPHQLRHVSFLSDDHFRSVLAAHALEDAGPLASRLDVRRNSVFDVATGVAPVLVLDEHFRSDPHLVEFVARRLYGGRVRIATRSPVTESRDCVRVVRLGGRRDGGGVVRAEVDRAIAEVWALLDRGRTSVGVVTPFRAQADALEEAALKAFTVDELDTLDLRVGTVHSFQGNERDIVIASLGIGPDEGAASWRFVEDPHLFAVFATRARRRLVLLTSAEPPEDGLVAAYLAQADAPPAPPKPAGPVSAWAGSIADELRTAGLSVTSAYPSGRHLVDICVRELGRSLGIECGVHPDGPDAHIHRHLDLARRDWDLLEAYPSRWVHRRGELVVSLVQALSPPADGP